MKRSRRHQKGHVFRKGSSWYLRYYDYAVQPNQQTVLQKKCVKLAPYGGEFRSKKAVRTLADEFLKPFNDGTFTPKSAMTMRDFVEDVYLPHVDRQMKPSTANGYKKMWSRYFKERAGISLRDFRTVDCERFLTEIAFKYDLRIRTLSHVKHLLSGIFRYAIRTGYLNGMNPVRDACLPKGKPSADTYAYSCEEVTEMIDILPEPARTLVAIAAFTGLRAGELRGLELADYDSSVLHVRRSAWRKHIDIPKGKRGKGAVPVIPRLRQILDAYIAAVKPTKYLFQNQKGTPADLGYIVLEVIIPILMENKMKWHGWHAFRRGLATNLHQIGVADIVIQAILRHSDVAVTRESYILRDGVDMRSLAAMEAFQKQMDNQRTTAANETESLVVIQ